MTADERRLQILQIAVQLFSQRGFRGTTTREIALAAGVSEAMVFRHFATKHELYAAILDFVSCNSALDNLDECCGEAIAAKNDFDVFYKLGLDILRNHEKDTEFMRLLMHSALEGHELAAMFFDNYIVKVYNFLSDYIKQRQLDGVMREVDPNLVVRGFMGMVIHHSLNNTLWDANGRLLKISNEAAARQFTEILLNGVKSNR